ncbi:Cgr1-domain-containing protein [Lophium mytilinum]|uniref:rRNA-processing protein n=1 Tax=Lophium mytilinum TaxID=390894 RepID=A0A6A6R2C5_9PEZI|nr:Cgr1-domain-containing protein [Lophium mytilinum]
MSVEAVATSVAAPAAKPAVQGIRINGKQWHEKRAPLRKNAGLTSYQKRAEDTKVLAAIKAKEKEMKDEKEAERLVGLHYGRPTRTGLIKL